MTKMKANTKPIKYFFSGAALVTYAIYKQHYSKPASIDNAPTQRNASFSSTQLSILPKYSFQHQIQPQETIIFMHTPKTGGTNLNFIAMALGIDDPKNFLYERFRAPRNSNKSSIKIEAGWRGSYEVAKEQLKNSDTKYSFICGHFPFGLHIYSPKVKYVGLVRDPLQRILSIINFNFQRGLINNYDQATENLFSEIDNPQTRLFAGIEYMDGACTQQTLEQAKSNIKEHFMLVAPTEETETFLAILASIQRWKPIAIARQQITGNKILDTVSDELRDEIMKKNSFDAQLHMWVRDQWHMWKTLNIAATTDNYDVSDKLLCIMPDFGSTQKPVYLLPNEIQAYNKKNAPGLVNLSQEYLSKNKAPKAKL